MSPHHQDLSPPVDECRRRGGAGRGLSQGRSWRGSRIRGFDPLPCEGVVLAHLCSGSSLGCSGAPVDTCGGVAAGQGKWGCRGPGRLSQWENRTRGGGFLKGAASFPRTARRLRAGVCKTLREHEEGQFCHPSHSGGERSRAGPRPRPGRGWAASGQMVVSIWAQGYPQPGARCPVREARSRPEGSGGEGPPKS